MTSLGSQGFPKRLMVRHKYVERINRTPGAAADVYQVSTNGMFDPNISGTGHQPLYFDQVGALYNQYIVFRSTCTFEIVNSAASILCLAYVEDDLTVSTDSQAAEMSTSRVSTHLASATESTKLTRTWNAKQNYGGDIYDHEYLNGTPTANPVEQMFFTLVTNSMDGVATPTYNFVIEVVYEAVWTELKTVPQS